MTTEELIIEILEGKEKRADKQKYILDNYNNTLISFSLNIPGLQKRNEKYKKIFRCGVNKIKQELRTNGIKIVYSEIFENLAGYVFFCSINSNATFIKALMIDIESRNKIARLFDIDVFDKNKNLLSRQMFSVRKRKCLVCDDDAVICGRSRKHEIDEVLQVINNMIDLFLKEEAR